MRDQEREAARFRLRARVLNSDMGEEEQKQVLQEATQGNLDLLYIAPERLNNPLWQEWYAKLPIRAVVVDEAHCISLWGHDFRPDYRRIVEIVRTLPPNVPVIAVTATATPRVEEDIKAQIGEPVRLIRGRLVRENLQLRVLKVEGNAEKLARIYQLVGGFPGTGIVYTATKASAENIAAFLQEMGVDAVFYHSNVREEKRLIEERLMNNDVKVVVATNALGMGLNKPDIRFIIHAEFPGSLLAYYQEIGRAGRDGKPAEIVLLYDSEDKDIQDYFIENNKPSLEAYQRVQSILQKEVLRQTDLELKTGLPRTALRNILQDLIDQGVVAKMDGAYRAISAQEVDFSKFEEIRRAKREELAAMLDYIHTTSCRMAYLCNHLGDATAEPCGMCDNCAHYTPQALDPDVVELARGFSANPRLPLSPRLYQDGRALDYYAGTEVGTAIKASKYQKEGPYPDWLVDKAVEVLKKHWSARGFDGVVHVPSTTSGDLVGDFASRLAAKLGIPHLDVVRKARPTEPQKNFTNRIQKRHNLAGAFACTARLRGRLLVVDDVYDSGVTLEEMGKILKKAGAEELYALTLAKTRHSDDV